MALKTKPKSNNNSNMQAAMAQIKKDNSVKLTISISKSMRSEFKIAAERKGSNMSTVILQYVKQYIGKEV